MGQELIYVADPMCSWCYGFAPELSRFLAQNQLPLRLVMGGLWARDRAQPLEPDLQQYLRTTWQRVGDVSGQQFTFALLDEPGWVYDTEPACRAVVTMRTVLPDHETAFFARLQRAFYAEGRDLTDDFVYPDLVGDFPIDIADFMLMFRSAEMVTATEADFALAGELGVAGFPTLLLEFQGSRVPLARGFTRAEQMDRVLQVLGGG